MEVRAEVGVKPRSLCRILPLARWDTWTCASRWVQAEEHQNLVWVLGQKVAGLYQKRKGVNKHRCNRRLAHTGGAGHACCTLYASPDWDQGTRDE
jgi:hypothetical protein